MRILEQKKISFKHYTYECEEFIDGAQTADLLGLEHKMVFKTLVARGERTGINVFCIPVCCELDLKKAARAVGEKSIAMIHLKELFPLTGYVHGGCSPIGMKKQFPTVIDETCILYDSIFISAGKIGLQLELNPDDLIALTDGSTADLLFEEHS